MRKLSNTHAVAINKLMLPLISTLAHIDDDNDINMYKMYALYNPTSPMVNATTLTTACGKLRTLQAHAKNATVPTAKTAML